MSKQMEAAVYTTEDLTNMTDRELFGLYCQVKTDSIPLPEANDYARIYKDFKMIPWTKIVQFLVDERINK